MRFDQIEIPAFGPFTDFSLRFDKSCNHTDLHLIYGANEAGKSSLLRAINHMLYGIPARSTDTFIHSGSQMYAGATISEGSRTLSFLRKKGNKNTLLDTKKNSIQEDTLSSFLDSVDKNFFLTMFGLNTQSLREGAKNILSGEGDLSTILFSASLGGSPIENALKSLESEANLLYKGTARTNVSIPPAIKSYQEHEKLAKSTATKPSAWRQMQKNLSLAKTSATQAHSLYHAHHQRLTELRNIISALPAVKGLKAAEQDILKLNAPLLASDFIPRVRKLQHQIQKTKQALQFLTTQEETNAKELSSLPDNQILLTHTTSIQTLYKELVSYQEKEERADTLTTEISALKQKLNSLLDQLELHSATELHSLPIPTVEKTGALKKLATSLLAHLDQQAQCKKDLHKLKLRQTKLNKQFSEQPDTTALSTLESLITLADQHVKKTITTDIHQKDLESLKKQISRLREQLSFSKDSHTDSIHAIKMLSEDTILEYRDHFTQALKQQEKKAPNLESLTHEYTEKNHHFQQLSKETPIYAKSNLTQARRERDQLWLEIKTKPSKVSPSQLKSLDESIHLCDEIVDTLHNHAKDIAKAKEFQQKVSLLSQQITDAEKAHDLASQKLNDLQSVWNALCDSIPLPHTNISPKELLEWRKKWITLCDALTRWEELAQLMSSHISDDSNIIRKLQKTLGTPAQGINNFTELHSLLKTTIKRANQQQGAYMKKKEDLLSLSIEIEQTQEQLNGFDKTLNISQQKWAKLCTKLALTATHTPETAKEILSTRENAHNLAAQLLQASKSLEQIKVSLTNFNTTLSKTSEAHLDKTQQKLPPNIQVIELNKLLTTAQETKAHGENLTKKNKALTLKIAEEKASSQSQLDELTKLYKQAKIKTDEELESLVHTLESKATLTIKTEHYRETLSNLAGNKSIHELIKEAENADTETAQQEITQLESTTDQILENRDNAHNDLKSCQAQLNEMQSASDTAARHKQSATNALSTIITDVERYIKLQHAIHFLKSQVEAFREKNQGPMIERTSNYFRKLTRERYIRVVAQLDDKGAPQLLAVRKNEALIPTSGLSEGTADQLYLALRLAAIDLHLEKHSPIPLILDDLLITFDDDRTRALLPVLEELSKKTQIFIFTHHHHLKKLTKEVSLEIQQHQLSS